MSPDTPVSNNKWLLLAMGTLGGTAIGAIVLVSVYRPDENTLAVIGLITAFATATIASLYAAVSSARTADKVQTLSVSVDGRLSQLLETTRRAERAEGHIEGVQVQMERDGASAAGLITTAATVAADLVASAAAAAPGAPAHAVVIEKADSVTIEKAKTK